MAATIATTPSYEHQWDLPQLHEKPSAEALLNTLNEFALPPPSWGASHPSSGSPSAPAPPPPPKGFDRWLVSIVASPLGWIAGEAQQEAIKELASIRISERCGRSARGEMRRRFWIRLLPAARRPAGHTTSPSPPSSSSSSPSSSSTSIHSPFSSFSSSFSSLPPSSPSLPPVSLPSTSETARPALQGGGDGPEGVEIELWEPALTEDNLGLKTWASSYLLSMRLSRLSPEVLPITSPPRPGRGGSGNGSLGPPPTRILELGAGTGLVGLSAAAIFGVPVLLTDLPPIVPNLQRNVDENATRLLACGGGQATAQVLDWGCIPNPPLLESVRYDVILAADPLYSPDHPRLLVDTVCAYLRRNSGASRVVVEMPLRRGYVPEREEFRERMLACGLQVVDEGWEAGRDDWEGDGGEVDCWWAVWAWAWACAPEGGQQPALIGEV